MAIMNGRQLAQERLLDAAALVLDAYYKAPLATSRLDQQALVLTDEEILPLLEVIEKTAEKMGGFDAIREEFMPLYMDYVCFREAIDKGCSPVVLLLGANLSKPDLGWDCGACGFKTCGQMAKHFKSEGGPGRVGAGPSCAWKVMDYGIACDYACAAAWQLNLENRIEGTMGMVAGALGYMDGVTSVLALPLGPVSEFWYYNRPTLEKIVTVESHQASLRSNVPQHFMMFAGDLRPTMKSDGKWWENPPEYLNVGADPEFVEKDQQNKMALIQSVMEVVPKVEAMKETLKAKTATK